MKIKRTETPTKCEKRGLFCVTRCVYLGGTDQTWCAKYGSLNEGGYNSEWM